MINKDFFEALAEIVETKGIDETSLIDSIENALSCGYKRLKGDAFDVKVKLNKEKNSIKFYVVKMVVETVENPDKEITLEDAKQIKKSAKVGELVELSEIMPKDEFDRITFFPEWLSNGDGTEHQFELVCSDGTYSMEVTE